MNRFFWALGLASAAITFTFSACSSEQPARQELLYVSEVHSQVRGAVATGIDGRGFITGWASAVNKPFAVVDVHVYIDGDASQRERYVGRVRANQTSRAAVSAMGHEGSYGFRFTVPRRFRDGKLHTAHVYAINPSGQINPRIGTVRFRLRNARAFGVLGKLGDGALIGWALDTDNTEVPLRVRVVIDNRRPDITHTTVHRDDVNQAYGVTGRHGFRYVLPIELRDGRLHRVRAYVEDDDGRRVRLLSGSQQTFAIGDGVELSGPMKTVFSHARGACETEDIPDLPARALRDADGQIHLYASHHVSYRTSGADFDSLERACREDGDKGPLIPAYRSHLSPDPRDFANFEWLAATFRLPQTNEVYALLHVEYEGHRYGTCPGYDAIHQSCLDAAQNPAQIGKCNSAYHNACQETTIVAARSSDGGKTFVRSAIPEVVAARAKPYAPTGARFGYMEPSNILHANDGYYYIFVHTEASPRDGIAKLSNPAPAWQKLQDWGTCLLRTKSLTQPDWRAYDGKSFSIKFVDPYREDVSDPTAHTCPPLARDQLAKLANSLTWNTYLKRYVLIGVQGKSFYYATSKDLIHWEPRRLIAKVNASDSVQYLYPSLIDHRSERPNFDHSGREAYLYFTRNNKNPKDGLDRDLVRLKIRFGK